MAQGPALSGMMKESSYFLKTEKDFKILYSTYRPFEISGKRDPMVDRHSVTFVLGLYRNSNSCKIRVLFTIFVTVNKSFKLT